MEPIDYDKARFMLADALERAAEAQSPWELDEECDQLVAAFRVRRESGARFTKVFIALAFSIGWVDEAEHDWQYYYDGFEVYDWPLAARAVAQALQSDVEIDHPLVLRHFGTGPRHLGPGRVRRAV